MVSNQSRYEEVRNSFLPFVGQFSLKTGLRRQKNSRPFHSVMQIDTYTGGAFETNCFFISSAQGGILIDAPEGTLEWLQQRGVKVSTLLLTHGHIDHMQDAARIKAAYGCRVGYHTDGTVMLTDPGFFRRIGFPWDIEPVTADFLIEETDSLMVDGMDFKVLHVPGHCPGSLCFFSKSDRILFGGDVLFAGGVGRWDLPGGDRLLLFAGIVNKLLPLGDDVQVLPGHGPATTVRRERETNPFLAGAL
jgi:glyoxylase-like metal-dependent hydrolase (beta-lactamase superfamily II)